MCRALPKTSLLLFQGLLGDLVVEQADQALQQQVGAIPLTGYPQLAPKPQKEALQSTPRPPHLPKEHRQPQQNSHHLANPAKPTYLKNPMLPSLPKRRGQNP
jgi:hypothetical protein